VVNGQISQAQIDASVARILEMKLHYKVIPHDKALQLAKNAVNVGSQGNITCPCNAGIGDVDVRKIAIRY
jgi:hypothetical protein